MPDPNDGVGKTRDTFHPTLAAHPPIHPLTHPEEPSLQPPPENSGALMAEQSTTVMQTDMQTGISFPYHPLFDIL
jgi:hypothetical protein